MDFYANPVATNALNVTNNPNFASNVQTLKTD